MTSMTTPPPLAEFLPAAPGTALPVAEGADAARFMVDATGVPRAADFAALLQGAGLRVPPLVAAEGSAAPREPSAEAAAADVEASSAIDGLLFLAVVQAPVVAEGSPSAVALARAAAGMRDATPLSVVDKRLALDPRSSTTAASTAHADAADRIAAEAVADAGGLEAYARRLTSDPLDAVPRPPAGDRVADRVGAKPTLDLADAPVVVAAAAAQRAVSDAKASAIDAPLQAARGVEPTISLSPSQPAAPSAPSVVTIETPVHDPSWRLDAAARIVSLVTRGIEHAELRVTPPELGPVELRIDVRGGEATLAIVAAQPSTRDALEQALPQLRDMLAQHGLSLGQATVADGRAEAQSGGRGSASSPVDPLAGNDAPDDPDGARAPRASILRGVIDVFA